MVGGICCTPCRTNICKYEHFSSQYNSNYHRITHSHSCPLRQVACRAATWSVHFCRWFAITAAPGLSCLLYFFLCRALPHIRMDPPSLSLWSPVQGSIGELFSDTLSCLDLKFSVLAIWTNLFLPIMNTFPKENFKFRLPFWKRICWTTLCNAACVYMAKHGSTYPAVNCHGFKSWILNFVVRFHWTHYIALMSLYYFSLLSVDYREWCAWCTGKFTIQFSFYINH